VEVVTEPVGARRNSAEILEPPEHPLDHVAVPSELRREAVLPDPVGLRRDVWSGAGGLDFPAHGIGVIAIVPMHQVGGGHLVGQRVGRQAVSDLAAGQQECDGTTVLVGQGMDFGRALAARAADRLALLPPFPPEAQRCAFTAEESINASAGGPPAVARA